VQGAVDPLTVNADLLGDTVRRKTGVDVEVDDTPYQGGGEIRSDIPTTASRGRSIGVRSDI
jgi:hypothetical protein